MSNEKLRGINDTFTKAFKNSVLYALYKDHKDELIIGIRNNYLNLYYNCDSIAKIMYKNKSIICELDKYYLDGNHYKEKKEKQYKIEPYEIFDNYEILKKHSNERTTNEKKAQSKLVILNNEDKSSNWFCIDIEYKKSFLNQIEKDKSNFKGRFDIIAISKKSPHKVAIIELKYSNKSIESDKNDINKGSGIYKHIKDFYEFYNEKLFEKQLKQEIVNIIKSFNNLGIKIPFDIPEINSISTVPEFYVITLDNKDNRPKQLMGEYLFNDKRWGGENQPKEDNFQKKFIDVLDINNEFHVTFLFSTQNLEEGITINDIIEDSNYCKEPK